MTLAPPLTIEVPEGGIGQGNLAVTTTSPGDEHTLQFVVQRDWCDVMVGGAAGEGDISRAKWGRTALRLEPGWYSLTFTPGVATFYISARRDKRGLTALTDMEFVGAAADLVVRTPYQEEDLRGLRFTQSRDVRLIFHTSHAPRALTRYSNDSWGLSAWRNTGGPFMAAAGDESTMTPAATSGVDVDIECNRDFFEPDHVGGLVEITHLGQRVSRTITAEDQWSDPIRVVGVNDDRDFRIQITGIAGGTIVTLQRSVGTDYEWTSIDTFSADDTDTYDDGLDNVVTYYRIGVESGDFGSGSTEVTLTYSSGTTAGVGRIVSYTDARHVSVDVLTNFAKTDASRNWREGSWSGFRGWPAAGDLFDGRLWAGMALDVFASGPDKLTVFAVGSGDGDAINRSMTVGDASPIRWIKGAFRLLVGTDAGAADIDAVRIGDASVLQIRSSAFDEPITPTNMTLRETSARLAYVNSTGFRLLRLRFDLETNSFVDDDLTRMHADIARLGDGFIDLAYQARPVSRLWAPRADGQLPQVTASEAEDVVGWSRIALGWGSAFAAYLRDLQDEADEDGEAIDLSDELAPAAVESVSVVPAVDGGHDEPQDYVHLIVARVSAGGVLGRFHERLAAERWMDPAEAWHVERGVRYEGEPASYLWGLDHLLGESVYVWGDAAQFGPFEVVPLETLDDSFTDGEIGVYLGAGVEVSTAIIGLPMRTRYLSGKLPYGAQAGSAVGETKRVTHVTFLFYKTALGDISVGIVDGNAASTAIAKGEEPFDIGDLQPIVDAAEGFTTDDAAVLYTGELQVSLGTSTDHMGDPRLAIEVRGCAPAAILGYVVNMVTNERP